MLDRKTKSSLDADEPLLQCFNKKRKISHSSKLLCMGPQYELGYEQYFFASRSDCFIKLLIRIIEGSSSFLSNCMAHREIALCNHSHSQNIKRTKECSNKQYFSQ